MRPYSSQLYGLDSDRTPGGARAHGPFRGPYGGRGSRSRAGPRIDLRPRFRTPPRRQRLKIDAAARAFGPLHGSRRSGAVGPTAARARLPGDRIDRSRSSVPLAPLLMTSTHPDFRRSMPPQGCSALPTAVLAAPSDSSPSPQTATTTIALVARDGDPTLSRRTQPVSPVYTRARRRHRCSDVASWRCKSA
jgi:hypothetical protein